jgi:site-specific recombinase XerD
MSQSTLELNQVVKEFQRSLVSRNMSPRTGDAYRFALSDFLAYVKRHGVVNASELSSEHIEGWQANMAQRGLAPRSRSLAGTALRQCLIWAVQHDKPIKANLHMKVNAVHVPEALPQPLALEDVTKVLKYYSSVKKRSTKNRRDRALFLCLLSTGARISEVLQLKRKDLNRTSVVLQKGARPVTLRLLAPVREAISEYVATRTDNHPNVWVTIKPEPGPMTPADVRLALRDVAQRAGIERFTTHQIRHTAATLMFDAKVPESLIADFLGHESIESIRNYVDMTSRRQEAAVAMERLLIEVEGETDKTKLNLERLATELEGVVAALESGSMASGDNRSEDVAQLLKLAARDLRRIQPPSEHPTA